MRGISEIIVHCTATREGQAVTVADITRWHKERGFVTIGYHYIIGLNGEVWKGRPEDQVGAHAQGHNSNSIGVCYVGGLDSAGKPKDTRTELQKQSLLTLINGIKARYPRATVHSHKEFANKACPCFDAGKEYDNA